MTLYETLRKNWIVARKAKSPEIGSYALIIGELDRLKGTKDKWTKTLQTGNPEDLIVRKICDELRKGEAEKQSLGVEFDRVLLDVLDREVPLVVKMTHNEMVEWLDENVDFSKLKNSMQGIGILKKEFGDAIDGTIAGKAVIASSSNGKQLHTSGPKDIQKD